MEIIRLTFAEYQYLLNHKKINDSMIPPSTKISIEFKNDDDLIDLHDWVSDKLQTNGFDENYELSEEGKLLNNLLDVLNV